MMISDYKIKKKYKKQLTFTIKNMKKMREELKYKPRNFKRKVDT